MSQYQAFFGFSGPGSDVESLTGDIGGPVFSTGNNINVITDNAGNNAGKSVLFSGNPGTSTLTLELTDANGNTYLGQGSGNIGLLNVGVGLNSLNSVTNGVDNIAIGYIALAGLTGTLIPVAGAENVAIGTRSMPVMTLGVGNVAIGSLTGTNYTTTESYNILIGYQVTGTLGESGVTRIGDSSYATATYIAGIQGVSVSNKNFVTINTATGQLGSQSAAAAATLTVTSVNNAASPYTVLSTDQFLAVDSSGGAVTIRLPNAPTTGRVIYVKDSTASAATFNITVTTVGGAVNIDGSTSYVMATNRQAISVVFDGTAYEVF